MAEHRIAIKEPLAELDFPSLISVLEQTHNHTRKQASQAMNQFLVVRNLLFGHYIVQYQQNGLDRAQYGAGTLKKLSQELKNRLGRGFSVDSLEAMRQFYLKLAVTEKSGTPSQISGNTISETVPRIFKTTQNPRKEAGNETSWLLEHFPLSWSHYVTLLTIDHPDERSFYEIESHNSGWSVRELKRQMDSALYQRLALSRDKDGIRKLAQEGQAINSVTDLIKDPFVLEFLDLKEESDYSEKDLETAIIDKLQSFLLEMGKGFLFVARQRRFTFDGDHYYVDLVLYNRLLRCFVIVDLKLRKLTHGDLGQMQMYVNQYDRHEKTDDELPTVGILLCAQKNDALVELTLPTDANIFASQYQLYLPSKEELRDELLRIEQELATDGIA